MHACVGGISFFDGVHACAYCAWAGKHVVFGRVLGGREVMAKIAHAGSSSGKPTKRVVIAHAGELKEGDGK